MAGCTVRFISDLHLGHKNLATSEIRKFSTVEEHDEYIINMWNKTVLSPKDLTFVLGDFTMERSHSYNLLSKLNGRIIGVGGNHDRPQDVRKLLEYIESINGLIEYKGFLLSHAPLHESIVNEVRGNIHGHIHSKTIDNPKYFNVCAEMIGYRPITINEMLNLKL